MLRTGIVFGEKSLKNLKTEKKKDNIKSNQTPTWSNANNQKKRNKK